MDNEELVRIKKDGESFREEEITESEELFEKYVIFYLNEKRYAVSSSYVKEITITEDVYFLPFVPSYIKGLINRHGEPHSVIDFSILIEGKNCDGNKFLIMNCENDKIAFITTDVEGIRNVSVRDFNPLSTEEEEERYFKGSVIIEGVDVLVLDPDVVLDKIRNSLK